MSLADDLFEVTSIDADELARLKFEKAASERYAAVKANCPCDPCPMSEGCADECEWFVTWVRTGKNGSPFV
jgi:hypothetical protein